MFKNIRTVKGVVTESSAYVTDVKEHFETNKDVYRGVAIGAGVGIFVVCVFKSRPLVVNNVINVCSHAS